MTHMADAGYEFYYLEKPIHMDAFINFHEYLYNIVRTLCFYNTWKTVWLVAVKNTFHGSNTFIWCVNTGLKMLVTVVHINLLINLQQYIIIKYKPIDIKQTLND